jgi:hypothetical protein
MSLNNVPAGKAALLFSIRWVRVNFPSKAMQNPEQTILPGMSGFSKTLS